MLRHAFDCGITHFDLANNYGPPYGSAEENFGRMMRTDFAPYRDEMIISTKAGWDMWPGPYGNAGSRKYVLSSLDASLARLSLDHVDLFYSHRFDPDTPVAETIARPRHRRPAWARPRTWASRRTRRSGPRKRSGSPTTWGRPW